jgi:hypothetical protein
MHCPLWEWDDGLAVILNKIMNGSHEVKKNMNVLGGENKFSRESF